MFVSLGTLNVSCNIVAQTSCSVLRFVVEDAGLHLSNRVSYGTVNLRRDYVCVLDIDLLELSLRMHSGGAADQVLKLPQFELQTSLNVVRLRTCADSCRLLLDLLTYLADDGDFDEKGVALSEDSSECSTTLKGELESLRSESLSSVNQEMEAQVNDMMAEAMLESSPAIVDQQYKVARKEEKMSSPTQVFFFPDENHAPFPVTRDAVHPREAELAGTGEPRGVWHEGVDQLIDDALDPACDDVPLPEEEFCILENDPGVGFTVVVLSLQFNPVASKA